MRYNRPIEVSDVVRIVELPTMPISQFTGKSGVVVKVHGDSICVVCGAIWEYGVWFNKDEIRRIGRVYDRNKGTK